MRPGDVDQRCLRHFVGNHKGCPYNSNDGATPALPDVAKYDTCGSKPYRVAVLPDLPHGRPVVVTGFFRANPSNAMVQERMEGTKGTKACRHC